MTKAALRLIPLSSALGPEGERLVCDNGMTKIAMPIATSHLQAVKQ